jgi:hypothetical protein
MAEVEECLPASGLYHQKRKEMPIINEHKIMSLEKKYKMKNANDTRFHLSSHKAFLVRVWEGEPCSLLAGVGSRHCF